MQEICTSGSMSGSWKRSRFGLSRLLLRYRATARLYPGLLRRRKGGVKTPPFRRTREIFGLVEARRYNRPVLTP
jgi:hypothetical protein